MFGFFGKKQEEGLSPERMAKEMKEFEFSGRELAKYFPNAESADQACEWVFQGATPTIDQMKELFAAQERAFQKAKTEVSARPAS